MDAKDKLNPIALPSSTEKQPANPTEGIAISAAELMQMINSGQGDDVNELVNRRLQDRQAA